MYPRPYTLLGIIVPPISITSLFALYRLYLILSLSLSLTFLLNILLRSSALIPLPESSTVITSLAISLLIIVLTSKSIKPLLVYLTLLSSIIDKAFLSPILSPYKYGGISLAILF